MRRLTIIAMFLVMCGLESTLAANLLANPRFEEIGGWTAYESSYLRNDWRSRSDGEFNAAICGLWSDAGMNGLIEQRNLPVVPGNSYFFKVWLWADLGWAPYDQFVCILFFDGNGVPVDVQKFPILGVYPVWTPFRGSVTAPAEAATASFAVGAIDVSSYGALTIDDAYFGPEPPPSLDL